MVSVAGIPQVRKVVVRGINNRGLRDTISQQQGLITKSLARENPDKIFLIQQVARDIAQPYRRTEQEIVVSRSEVEKIFSQGEPESWQRFFQNPYELDKPLIPNREARLEIESADFKDPIKKYALLKLVEKAFEVLNEKIGVEYITDQGVITGRISDLKNLSEKIRKLDPDGKRSVVGFVDGDIIKQAQALINDIPALRQPERLKPLNDRIIDWDALTFEVTPTDAMIWIEIPRGGDWRTRTIECVTYEKKEISPAAQVLSYAQEIFEGLKAFRNIYGEIVVAVPEKNAERMREGAQRLCLTPIPEDYFIKAIEQVVKRNARWIPPYGKGALYIRPVQIGSGSKVGVAPAPIEVFFIYVTPVGPYFKGGLKPISLLVEEDRHRACKGGTGNVKYGGNYSSGIQKALKAKKEHYNELVYLDAASAHKGFFTRLLERLSSWVVWRFKRRYIEEVGAANFFCIKNGVLYTPELSGTILPGITRETVINLARKLGYKVVEGKISVQFAMTADEAFCTGTAAVISPIGKMTWGKKTKTYSNNEVGLITKKLYDTLTGMQQGTVQAEEGYMMVIKETDVPV